MPSTESIGLSGLLSSQRLLELAGQNITNANTPGYHRQVAHLAVRSAGQEIGLGVEISSVRRVIDESLENALIRATSSAQDLTAQLGVLRQLETQLNPGPGSIPLVLEQFFNELELLAGQPDDLTRRRVVLNHASALTEKLNTLLDEIGQLQAGLTRQLEGAVAKINQLTTQIAALNAAIERNTVGGVNANDLSDKRDQLVVELAQLIDVRTVPQEHGSVHVLAAGVPVVLGNQALSLRAAIDAKNQAVIVAENLDAPLHVTGGAIHGLLEVRNQSLAEIKQQLEGLTSAIAQTMDGIHATGLGLTGPFTVLYGQRPATNVNLPLDNAGLTFPPRAGSLFVSVTNLTTGERVLQEVAIDPATQSLQDVATAISGVGNIQATVDPQSRTLTIVAASGFAFDFAGQLATAPDTLAITGTAAPHMGGVYTGAGNDTFTYTVVGSGAIGVAPNLALEARNSSGTLLGTWNIGQGYEPGSALPAIQGVRARLSAGTVNSGDSFAIQVVANADTSGLLPALGLNAFFEGEPGDLRVRADLLSNPENMAASRTGLPADGANLRRLASVRDQALANDGVRTFQESYADLAANIGSRVRDLEDRLAAEEAVGRGLEAERQSVSGVDPNEELMRLMQYQRSFQLSARFLSVVNETLAELLRLV
jgi:flagellar hook-associated protein 1 FlgK